MPRSCRQRSRSSASPAGGSEHHATMRAAMQPRSPAGDRRGIDAPRSGSTTIARIAHARETTPARIRRAERKTRQDLVYPTRLADDPLHLLAEHVPLHEPDRQGPTVERPGPALALHRLAGVGSAHNAISAIVTEHQATPTRVISRGVSRGVPTSGGPPRRCPGPSPRPARPRGGSSTDHGDRAARRGGPQLPPDVGHPGDAGDRELDRAAPPAGRGVEPEEPIARDVAA